MYTLEVPLKEIVSYIRIADIPNSGGKISLSTLVPVDDMTDYWQYAVNYGYIIGNKFKMPELINRYKRYLDKDSLISREVSLTVFDTSDFIIFEFPDEENALYFKIKFIKE